MSRPSASVPSRCAGSASGRRKRARRSCVSGSKNGSSGTSTMVSTTITTSPVATKNEALSGARPPVPGCGRRNSRRTRWIARIWVGVTVVAGVVTGLVSGLLAGAGLTEVSLSGRGRRRRDRRGR
ncbi:hypothetical protein GSU69_16580 [Rathayibacter festucae]|uniref:Uncharacterized protein n=1 Tax=Rathayibacter festucae TaxID=110937 RepID=A0ABX6H2V8_9MICO|nr:hypothetical protein GSU69_16580 [Rathayibacter festucae]